MRLVRSSPRSEEFEASFEESFTVYKKYQMAIHGDPPEKPTQRQYTSFLVESPLQVHIQRHHSPVNCFPQATLKKKFVSCPRAGWVFSWRLGTYFLDFWIFFFFKKLLKFLSKKKKKEKKKIATARLATILATRWTGNKLFFEGSPTKCYLHC